MEERTGSEVGDGVDSGDRGKERSLKGVVQLVVGLHIDAEAEWDFAEAKKENSNVKTLAVVVQYKDQTIDFKTVADFRKALGFKE